MAARSKGRRKLVVRDRLFLWYVAQDEDGMGPVLHLFTADKQVVVLYWLGRSRGYPHAPVLVASVRGAGRPVHPAPEWPARDVATPAFVRQVAEWAVSALVAPPAGGGAV